MYAVTGKILWVDLSNKTSYVEKIPEEIYENVLSGLGLAAVILNKHIPPHSDPMGADNVLAFVSGLLTGTGSFLTGRWIVAAKSPLTNTWGDANCGGNLAPAIKQAGYDGIFIKGSSRQPVYIYIKNDQVVILPADEYWGIDAIETENALIKKYQPNQTSVAVIGQAGENLSLISGIVNDRGRMAARSGLGAVMGSKKLKAIVITGNKKINVHSPEKMKELSHQFNRYIQFQPPFLPGFMTGFLGMIMRVMPFQLAIDGMLYKILLKKWGTISMNSTSLEQGDAPVKNWDGYHGDFRSKQNIKFNPDRFQKHEINKYHCYSCPLGCGGISKFPNRDGETHKPEYETVTAFGSLLLNEDISSIYEINDILNRAGMDSISAGASIAYAFECFEKGILSLEDTGGLNLTWGNSQVLVELLHQMIHREKFGAFLADGAKIAARKFGNPKISSPVHANGQELAMHDSRNDPGFAIHAVVEATPGRHTLGSNLYYEMFSLWKKLNSYPKVSMFYHKNKKYQPSRENILAAVANSKFISLLNGAGACLFGAFIGVHRFPIFEWLNAATGWQNTPEDYMQIGYNIHELKQVFNLNQSDSLIHSITPRAIGLPPQKKGANQSREVNLKEFIPAYFQELGWNQKTGQPTEQISNRIISIYAASQEN
jgi:aldehyde:ferredoxin oxidoreductase